MNTSDKTFNNNISLLHTFKLLIILTVYMIILKLTPDSIIMKLLITIPLTSGYSYVIYKAVRAKHFNIIDMFKGYKFCRRTRITFIWLEILDITLITIITFTLNQCSSNNLLMQGFMFLQALFMYYVSFRFSFIRYLSMNTFELKNKPLSYVNILKRSTEISKGQFISYLIQLIIATYICSMALNILFNLFHINAEFLTITSIITSIIVRYYEELLRIKILKKSDFKFNYE